MNYYRLEYEEELRINGYYIAKLFDILKKRIKSYTTAILCDFGYFIKCTNFFFNWSKYIIIISVSTLKAKYIIGWLSPIVTILKSCSFIYFFI